MRRCAADRDLVRRFSNSPHEQVVIAASRRRGCCRLVLPGFKDREVVRAQQCGDDLPAKDS